jgi:hypothetical protein
VKITKGININDTYAPWTEMILSGEKTIETRESPTLSPYIGQRVGLIRTHKKEKARLVGTAIIGEPILYDTEEKFRADEKRHRVPSGSGYDIRTVKYGYPMRDVKPLSQPIAVKSRGIVSRAVDYNESNSFQRLYDEILLEKKRKKKKSHKWNPKKYYRNSTYAFVPHSGFDGPADAGDGGGGDGG